MAKIKIISNPYEKSINYQRYDAASSSWVDINNGQYNGNLKKDYMINSFFPFIVKDVVDEVIDEFEGEKIELYFEGPSDEFSLLSDLISSEEYSGKLTLNEDSRYLDNAWEIIPDVREVFTKVDSVIRSSIADGTIMSSYVSDDIAKFSDASGDLIPICVLGNYSAGKSTFINALIGHEILPSGDKAVTAKVFRIFQTDDESLFSVTVRQSEAKSSVIVHDGKVLYDGFAETGLKKSIESALETINSADIDVVANKIISVINYYVPADGEIEYDSTIDVHIAFRGLWKRFPGRFMVLDTPGSNANSHKDHYEVLQDALAGMSNGIPVFVSEYDSLDSNDNNTLKEKLMSVEGLDTRFTMIIANKADYANLRKEDFTEEHEDEILNQAIPKDLYADGIYFVSSIIGLGSKTKGQLIDDHSAEIYADNVVKYSDPSNRFYKQLYRFNIMPSQIRSTAMTEAENCDDMIFANCGLFSVENEILNFAEKYSSYNKCEQSEVFLNRMIQTTSEAIKDATNDTEKEKKGFEDKLESEKRRMISDVTDASTKAQKEYKRDFDIKMQITSQYEECSYSVDDLNQMKDEMTKKQNEIHEFNEVEKDRKKRFDDIGDAFRTGIDNLKKKPDLDTLAAFGKSIVKETKEAAESQSRFISTKKDVGDAVDEDLIHEVNLNYIKQKKEAEQALKNTAAEFWNAHTSLFRQCLIDTVKMTDLSAEKKNEITQVITSYKQFDYVHEYEQIFKKDEFDYLINYGDIKLIKLDRILISQLSQAYSSKISAAVDDILKNVVNESYIQFKNWADSLVNDVKENIVDYSPALKKVQHKINEREEHINVLKERYEKLKVYLNDIAELIDWKER